MPNKTYKCHHCEAVGDELIYDIFMTEQCKVFKNSKTSKVEMFHGYPDKYDGEYPIWTKCSACGASLFGEAEHYLVDCEVEGASN